MSSHQIAKFTCFCSRRKEFEWFSDTALDHHKREVFHWSIFSAFLISHRQLKLYRECHSHEELISILELIASQVGAIWRLAVVTFCFWEHDFMWKFQISWHHCYNNEGLWNFRRKWKLLLILMKSQLKHPKKHLHRLSTITWTSNEWDGIDLNDLWWWLPILSLAQLQGILKNLYCSAPVCPTIHFAVMRCGWAEVSTSFVYYCGCTKSHTFNYMLCICLIARSLVLCKSSRKKTSNRSQWQIDDIRAQLVCKIM